VAALALGALLHAAAPVAASPVAPRVNDVSPERGAAAGGTTVTITGEDFTGATAVDFGSREAPSFKVISPTEIAAVSPPWKSGNAIAEVTVATMAAGSVNSLGDSFVYEPAVTKIEPSSGPAAGGTPVTITGEAFEGHFENGAGEMPPFLSGVDFGPNRAGGFKGESETTITAVSPPGTGTADVTVTTLGGVSAISPADRFLYAPWGASPVIESESVSHVTTSDATLEAQIDTEGLETTYRLHIVEELCNLCESLGRLFNLPPGELLGSFSSQSVSVDLNSVDVGLTPYDTYWVTASNAAGTAEGAPQRFTAPGAGVQPLDTTTQSGGGSSSQPTGASTPRLTDSTGAKPAPTTAHSRERRRHRRHRHHRRHRRARAGAHEHHRR
jgi:hypothetical protein